MPRLSAALVCGVLILVGCSESPVVDAGSVSTQRPCASTNECPSGESCFSGFTNGLCTRACITDGDCGGESCQPIGGQRGCMKRCAGDVECRVDFTCSVASVCDEPGRGVDAGSGGGSGGGSAGGSGGGGGGGGGGSASGDGGAAFTNILIVTVESESLAVGTPDKTVIAARVVNANSGVAVVGASVKFQTSLGAFAFAGPFPTASDVTDAMGEARATLWVWGGATGTAIVDISSPDTEAGNATVAFVRVATIQAAPDSTVKAAIGIRSSGRDTTTPVIFKVLDESNQPVRGIRVSFTIGLGSPGGSFLSPNGPTDGFGNVSTTLNSGDQVGNVSVIATVSATVGTGTPVLASTSVQVVGGLPCFRGLTVVCDRQNLAALTNPAGLFPTRPLQTACRAVLADRFYNSVGLPTPVSWFAERGSITNSTSSNGIATTIYDSASAFPPNDTMPLTTPMEPSDGSKNPRDMIISVVAVVAGEEEFTDTNSNGKWDPGEWFLDLPEPFVDENDNQQRDPGELFLDSPRLNCTTGAIEPRNVVWDGPNGCWDHDTRIFATTHLVWSGPLANLEFGEAPPWTVTASQNHVVGFTWSDAWLNPIANDGAIFLASLQGSYGTATVLAPTVSEDRLGHQMTYEKVEATESATGSGIFTVAGLCDTAQPGPTNPLTRCLARYRFVAFGRGTSGMLHLEPQTAFPDGGTRPPATATVQMRGQNNYFSPVIDSFPANFE